MAVFKEILRNDCSGITRFYRIDNGSITTLDYDALINKPKISGKELIGDILIDISDFDLSNYYNDVKPEDLLTKSGQYLIESAQKVDNSMMIAMQNGYSVQDVCNIRLAEMAYKASAYVFDVAEEISTFALDV